MAVATQIHQSSSSVRSTPRRPAHEVFDVYLDATDVDGELHTFEFELDCRRGTFFQALRKYLTAARIPSDEIEYIIEHRLYLRDKLDEYRVPEQPLFTPVYED